MNLRLQGLRERGPLGGAGIAGVVLLALALTLHVGRVAPLERELSALQAEAGSLQSRLRSGKSIATRADENSAEQLAAFEEPDRTLLDHHLEGAVEHQEELALPPHRQAGQVAPDGGLGRRGAEEGEPEHGAGPI